MPDPAAFHIAIQTPQLLHPSLGELRAGEILRDKLGLPKANSGNFAVVYQSQLPHRTLALRCFLRPASDQLERYDAIKKHLEAHPSEHFVWFDYHREGLYVDAEWAPLMVMEWRHGTRFEEHVKSLLGDSGALLQLAADWVDLFEELRRMKLAHGDIHADNVIVSDGKLVLIDYDAIFVPALAGRTLQEGGQKNYQHPGRTARDYGPHMDHFPSWVVYFTLLMLCVDPGLWDEYQGGDQALVFRAEDYADPLASPLFQRLRASDIAIFNTIDHTLRTFLAGAVQDVPALTRVGLHAAGFPLPPQPATWWVTPHTPSQWWRDHLHDQTPAPRPSWPPKKK